MRRREEARRRGARNAHRAAQLRDERKHLETQLDGCIDTGCPRHEDAHRGLLEIQTVLGVVA